MPAILGLSVEAAASVDCHRRGADGDAIDDARWAHRCVGQEDESEGRNRFREASRAARAQHRAVLELLGDIMDDIMEVRLSIR